MRRERFLKTKLYTPPTRRHLLQRPRLTGRLDEGLHYPLTLLSAPAGFGKTTLLSTWCEAKASDAGFLPLAWISLDKSDNDPIRFFEYVIAALETLHPGIDSEQLVTLLHASQPVLTETFLTALVNILAAFPQDFVLIFDDYHEIDAQPITDALLFLLSALPQHMHLFIASRTEPLLALPRLRARGQLNELRASDLRFTRDEAANFLCDTLGLPLVPADVALLEERTEGWITGLQLAALSMRGRKDTSSFIASFTGEHRYVADYLFTEVLDQQPEHMQLFLLYTASLQRLSGALCNALMEQEDGQATLEALEQANLFLFPLDDQRQWYHYHQLFRDFLLARLQNTQPEMLPVLRRRASDWYEKNGLPAEAIEYAIQAGDVEHAANLIERHSNTLLLRRGEVRMQLHWMEVLPEALIRLRPQLSVDYAWVLYMAGQADAAERRLNEVERNISVLSEFAGDQTIQISLTQEEVKTITANIAMVRATIASFQGDMQQSVALSQQALAQSSQEDVKQRCFAAFHQAFALVMQSDTEAALSSLAEANELALLSDNIYIAFMSAHHTGLLRSLQGKPMQALHAFQHAIQIATRQADQLLDVGISYMSVGMIYYEWNELDKALYFVSQGIERAEKGGNVRLLLYGYVMLAQVKYAQGENDSVASLLQKVEQLVQQPGFAEEAIAEIAVHLATFYLMQGNLEAATPWIQNYVPPIDDSPVDLVHTFNYLTLSRMLLMQKKFAEAVGHLDKLYQFARAKVYVLFIIRALVLKAVILYKQRSIDQAIATVTEALSYSEVGGWVRIFVDEGAAMEELLQHTLKAQQKGQLVTSGLTASSVHKLLAAFSSPSNEVTLLTEKTPHSVQPLLVPLSERELEVLHLITTGLSNHEIAQKLIIEMNTLKTHIKHLYSKLNVQTRTQAIVRARELHIG